jgi:undecaprenyl-diphosphatase
LREAWPPLRITPGAWGLAGCVLLFAAVAQQVVTGGALTSLDARVAAWFDAHATPHTATLMRILTTLGSRWVVTPLVIAAIAVLASRRRWYWAVALAAGTGGGAMIFEGLKIAFHRPRPEFAHPMVSLTSFSFPSGHAMIAAVLYGLAGAWALGAPWSRRRRRVALFGAIVVVLLVSVSRIYLGAHYLSDVAAGLAAGAAWLLLCLIALELVRRRSSDPERSARRR